MNRRIFVGLLAAIPFVSWFKGSDKLAMYTLPREYFIPGPYQGLDRDGYAWLKGYIRKKEVTIKEMKDFYEGNQWQRGGNK